MHESLGPRPPLQETPVREARYLECKVILRADRFMSAKNFFEYAKLVERVAAENDVAFSNDGVEPRPKIREVIFFDTAKHRLYNNSFILRRRVPYKDGFPVEKAEMVLKFRHPDAVRALETDVRPRKVAKYEVKFKAEVLPLRDRLGGYRMLYSHNAVFGANQAPTGAKLTAVFPCLKPLLKAGGRPVKLVNHTIVEEVLQDLGTFDFGSDMRSKYNVAIWRERGMHLPLIGEFAFQVKIRNGEDFYRKPLDRLMRIFVALQQRGADWISLGTTKTGIVYKLRGNLSRANE